MTPCATVENENDRPPFDKGGLQGGTHWDRTHLPLTPSLCKEGGFSRRDVIKSVGTLLASSLVAVPSPAQSSKNSKKVILAGGGIGGLCCAYELMKRGHEVTVLEASGRTGGHVLTLRDHLADGLYVDAGAEHFTKPGYDRYWQYVKEFELPYLAYPRRPNVNRFINGRMYTPEMLADRNILKSFGFNQREIDFLANHQWWEFQLLYFRPYLDSFENEYRPFDAKLDSMDQITVTDLLRKDGASDASDRVYRWIQFRSAGVVAHGHIEIARCTDLASPGVSNQRRQSENDRCVCRKVGRTGASGMPGDRD